MNELTPELVAALRAEGAAAERARAIGRLAVASDALRHFDVDEVYRLGFDLAVAIVKTDGTPEGLAVGLLLAELDGDEPEPWKGGVSG